MNMNPLQDTNVLARIINPSARSAVIEIDLASLGITNYGTIKSRGFLRPCVNPGMELFVNHAPCRLAQWPNMGEPPLRTGVVIDEGSKPREGDLSGRPAVFGFDYARAQHWQVRTNIWLAGTPAYDWADDVVRIAVLDLTNQTVTTDGPHMYGFSTNRPYHVFNLLEEIDTPFEYWIDRQAGLLYFIPPTNAPLDSIAVSLLDDPLVSTRGCSNVRFENITWEVTRGMGIYIEGGENNTVQGCTVCNTGSVGISIGMGTEPFSEYRFPDPDYATPPARRISGSLGSLYEALYEDSALNRNAGYNHRVISCSIYNTGAGGISLSGGDRTTLSPGGSGVFNTTIRAANRLDRTGKGCINIDGVGNVIEHCDFSGMDYIVVFVHGNDHVIQFNAFHDIVMGDETGALYLGRDPSETGLTVRHNFFHGLSGTNRAHAIFLDDGASFHTIEGNVFYDLSGRFGALHVNGGHYNTFLNNIVVNFVNQPFYFQPWADTLWAKLLNSRLWSARLVEDINVMTPPYCERYPWLADIFTAVYQPTSNVATNNLIMQSGDPGFVDMVKLDLRLREDAPVWTNIPGFRAIPFEKIGLLGNRPRADAGADQEVEGLREILLDASASYEPQNLELSFAWEQTSGPELVALMDASAMCARFVPTATGRYVFAVSVSNGISSDKDFIAVNIKTPDIDPPILVSANVLPDARSVLLEFSEPLAGEGAVGDAGLTANYSVDYGASVTGVVHLANSSFATLQTSPLHENVEYTLGVRNIRDNAVEPNQIMNTTTALVSSASFAARGYLAHLLHLGEDYDHGVGAGSISNDYFIADGGEALLRPSAGDSWLPEGTSDPMVWTPSYREEGRWAEGDPGPIVQYWSIAIFCPSARSARLIIQHNKQVRAWLNGDLVAASDIKATTTSGLFSLRDNWSQFVFKLEAPADEALFMIRITDPAGKDMADLRWRYALPPSCSDEAGDGLPDAWQQGFFGQTAVSGYGPYEDWDRDGFSNIAEYLAGTDPSRADSLLWLYDAQQNMDQIVLKWPSHPGRMYAVDWGTNLVSGGYTALSSNIPATPPETEFTHPRIELPKVFYRVRLSVP